MREVQTLRHDRVTARLAPGSARTGALQVSKPEFVADHADDPFERPGRVDDQDVAWLLEMRRLPRERRRLGK